MAQLSDDCFAFGGPMMSVDEAVAIIATRVSAVDEIETVPLGKADGRILAGDISASLPLPPFTNSAVDGYAVRSGDLPLRRGSGVSGVGTHSGRRFGARTGQAGPRRADLYRRADAGRRRYRVHAGGRSRRCSRQGCCAGGFEARRQCAPRGRRHPARGCRARSRPAAAAAGRRARGRVRPDADRRAPAHPGRGVLDR